MSCYLPGDLQAVKKTTSLGTGDLTQTVFFKLFKQTLASLADLSCQVCFGWIINWFSEPMSVTHNKSSKLRKGPQHGISHVTKWASSPNEMLCCVITTRDNEVRLAYRGYLR